MVNDTSMSHLGIFLNMGNIEGTNSSKNMRLRLRIHVFFYMCIYRETEFVIDLRNGLHMRPVLKCAFHYDRVGSCVHLPAYQLNTATTTTTKQKQQKN